MITEFKCGGRMACALFIVLFVAMGGLALTRAAGDPEPVAQDSAKGPYNEKADARQDIQHALAKASEGKQSVIVVFGANWCPDCRMLDGVMKGDETAALLARDFRIVKVDVGRMDKNVELAEGYGVPLKKGIPALAILSTNNTVLYATKTGEIENARKMGPQAIYDFFKRVTAQH